MRRIRVTLSLCILTAFLAMLLIGCGGDKTQPQSTSKKIVISINNGAREGEDNRLEEQRQYNEAFMKRYPEASLYFDTWQFSPETFMVRMSGGNCTDVVGVFATEGTVVIEKGLAADITDLVKTWDKYPFVNQTVVKSITHNDRIFGLPVGGAGGCYVMTLFYNKDIFKEAGFEKAPDTWEELVEYGKKLTDRSKGRAGFGILGEKGGAGWHFLNWVWQAGGDFEVKKDGKWQAVFDSQEAVSALQFVKDLRWKHNILQEDVLCNNDDLFELFASERIAMAFFTPEYLEHLKIKYKMDIDKIGIALMPAGPGGRANQMGGAFSIVNPTIPKEKQQWAFKAITFDYELDAIELKCRIAREQGRIVGHGVLPVFHGEYQDKVDAIIDKYRTVPSQKELMQEAAKYVHTEPPYYCQQLYSECLGPAVQTVLTKKDADPQKILKDAAAEFQKRYLDKIGN